MQHSTWWGEELQLRVGSFSSSVSPEPRHGVPYADASLLMTSGPKRFINFLCLENNVVVTFRFETALRQFKLEFDAGTT